jgi:hypothetical protein
MNSSTSRNRTCHIQDYAYHHILPRMIPFHSRMLCTGPVVIKSYALWHFTIMRSLLKKISIAEGLRLQMLMRHALM